MSRDFKLAILILVPLGAGILLGRGVQYQKPRRWLNLEDVDRERPRTEAMLREDSRFKDVYVSPTSGQEGAFDISGSVETSDDLFELMKLVAGARLPVPISWRVHVTSEVPKE